MRPPRGGGGGRFGGGGGGRFGGGGGRGGRFGGGGRGGRGGGGGFRDEGPPAEVVGERVSSSSSLPWILSLFVGFSGEIRLVSDACVSTEQRCRRSCTRARGTR